MRASDVSLCESPKETVELDFVSLIYLPHPTRSDKYPWCIEKPHMLLLYLIFCLSEERYSAILLKGDVEVYVGQ